MKALSGVAFGAMLPRDPVKPTHDRGPKKGLVLPQAQLSRGQLRS